MLIGHESVERLSELSNSTVLSPGQVLPVLSRADVGPTTQAKGQDHCRFHNLEKGDRPPPPAA